MIPGVIDATFAFEKWLSAKLQSNDPRRYRRNVCLREVAERQTPDCQAGPAPQTSIDGGSRLSLLSRNVLQVAAALAGSVRRPGESSQSARCGRFARREFWNLAGSGRAPHLGRQ